MQLENPAEERHENDLPFSPVSNGIMSFLASCREEWKAWSLSEVLTLKRRPTLFLRVEFTDSRPPLETSISLDPANDLDGISDFISQFAKGNSAKADPLEPPPAFLKTSIEERSEKISLLKEAPSSFAFPSAAECSQRLRGPSSRASGNSTGQSEASESLKLGSVSGLIWHRDSLGNHCFKIF